MSTQDKKKQDSIIAGAYQIPERQEIERRMKKLEEMWCDFLKNEGENELEYFVHKKNLFEVIKRQDQRIHYFKIFHGLEYPCEYKYIAVECFWINTLKPFMVVDSKSSIYDAPNEKFSLYLILSALRAVYEIHGKEKRFVYPSKNRIKDILYDFKYCSLSREAMISFVETFADSYGIGISYILDNKAVIEKALRKATISELWEKIFDS